MEHELYLGKIIGYRQWQIHLNDIQFATLIHYPWRDSFVKNEWDMKPNVPWGPYSYLRSMNSRTKWKVNRAEARCPYRNHKTKAVNKKYGHRPHDTISPDPFCSCGIYAHYSILAENTGSWYITGVIEGWGQTVLAESGFRTQYAKVVALVGKERSPNLMAHIASLYKVPVFYDLMQLINNFPPTNAGSLGIGRY